MSQWKGYGPDNELRAHVGVTETGPPQTPAQGALTYEPYYGLHSKPFSLSTDPRALYTGPHHAAVLEDLLAAIRRREGLIVLTGEMGTGKTTLCRAALYQLDRKTFTTFVPDPFLSRDDLLRMLLVGFGEVSVDDLAQGRLKGVPRADLACRLYEFLTSLESVDAFAVLVIDEAQHLAPPLLDEIRALSELEAGRRLLQIVLVGQRELRARLRLPEMRAIAQRVTTVCELEPLTRDGVSGYVSHRLAAAGAVRGHVAFSSAALALIDQASSGIPRLVNRICDRALHYGYLDRASQVGQAHVARALHDLELTVTRVNVAVPAPEPVPEPAPVRFEVAAPSEAARPAGASAASSPKALFQKTAVEPSPIADDLRALLDLPVVSRQAEEPMAARTDRMPGRSRRPRTLGAKWVQALKTSLPALGVMAMLVAGGIAVSAVSARSRQVDLPPSPPSPLTIPAIVRPRRRPPAGESPAPSPVVEDVAPPAAGGVPAQTWVVQVAAFASPERSAEMVRRLSESGLPAYEVAGELGSRGQLNFVRLGPYESAEEADQVRDQLQSSPVYEGAFVRNITTQP